MPGSLYHAALTDTEGSSEPNMLCLSFRTPFPPPLPLYTPWKSDMCGFLALWLSEFRQWRHHQGMRSRKKNEIGIFNPQLTLCQVFTGWLPAFTKSYCSYQVALSIEACFQGPKNHSLIFLLWASWW